MANVMWVMGRLKMGLVPTFYALDSETKKNWTQVLCFNRDGSGVLLVLGKPLRTL